MSETLTHDLTTNLAALEAQLLQTPELGAGVPMEQVAKIGTEAVDLSGEAVVIPIAPTVEEQAVEIPSSNELSATPPLVWEELANGENKMKHIITTLPPKVFKTFTYKDGEQVAKNGRRRYEVGIDPEALGEVDAGTYRFRSAPGVDIDVEIIEDPEGNKFFNFKNHVSEDPSQAVEEYLELADAQPEEITPPGSNESTDTYSRFLVDFSTRLMVSNLTPTTREFYKKLGFMEHGEGDEARLLLPAPQTFKKIVDEKRLPIRLIGPDESGSASSSDLAYKQSFADQLDPIGTVELVYFLHDIQDDHFPGVFPGIDLDNNPVEARSDEPTLLSMLAPLARESVKKSDGDATLFLDSITMPIRDMIREFDEGHDVLGKAGEATGFYEKLGKEVGIEVSRDQFQAMLYRQVARHARNLRRGDSDIEAKAQALDLYADAAEKRHKERQDNKNSPKDDDNSVFEV